MKETSTIYNTSSLNMHPPLSKPPLAWRSEFWLGFFGWAIAAVVFLYPPLQLAFQHSDYRYLLGSLLILAPVITPLFSWIFALFKTVILRAFWYSNLYKTAMQEKQEFDQLKDDVFQLLIQNRNVQILEILRASFQNGDLYIAVRRADSKPINQGDKLSVIHKQDGRIMGLFDVTDLGAEEIIAVGTSAIDPVWVGFIREQGEVLIIPSMIAMVLSQGEVNNE